MKWVIGIPVWGPAYREIFLDSALPSIRAAMCMSDARFRFVIHTDRPDKVAEAFGPGDAVEIRKIPANNPYSVFGQCHAEVLREAADGEYVALLNADIVVSIEMFTGCEQRLAQGKRAVFTCGARTTLGDHSPPIGARAGELHDYSLEHMHPINRECFFGVGKTGTPSLVYFRDEQGVVLRAFHLHPVAVVKGPNLAFSGTIDRDLADCFSSEEIHVVTDRDELAMIEVSQDSKKFPLSPRPINAPSIAIWAKARTTKRHREFFRQPMVIQGKASGRDQVVVDQILRSLR